MIDSDSLKAQTNIVDIIDSFVPLKKQGKNHSACCPFHSEKTPSFTVSEEKQLFHCFGCGESGDVIRFLMEYNGYDFLQAAKYLGADVESQPLEKIARNERRSMERYRTPPDHKEDAELSQLCMNSCVKICGNVFTGKDGKQHYLPIATVGGSVINVYHVNNHTFLAGGLSYSGGHWNRVNDGDKWLAVECYELACEIASIYRQNVVTCFTGAVMKYVCMWNNGGKKIKPVLTDKSDDYLAYEMPWLKWDGVKLIKQNRID